VTELAAVRTAHAVLKPCGFRKRRHAWNRDVGEFVDVVHFQVSKGLDSFWVNLGTLDRRVHRLVWPDRDLDFYVDAECTIRRRLDEPLSVTGRDWDRDDTAAATEVPRLLDSLALDFFEEMHDQRRLAALLRADNARVRYRYPPDAIALAFYSHAAGDLDAAAADLDAVLPRSAKSPSPWHDRLDEVRHELGLPSRLAG
jgi:Domain of unknown function (DUF4304)